MLRPYGGGFGGRHKHVGSRTQCIRRGGQRKNAEGDSEKLPLSFGFISA